MSKSKFNMTPEKEVVPYEQVNIKVHQEDGTCENKTKFYHFDHPEDNGYSNITRRSMSPSPSRVVTVPTERRPSPQARRVSMSPTPQRSTSPTPQRSTNPQRSTSPTPQRLTNSRSMSPNMSRPPTRSNGSNSYSLPLIDLDEHNGDNYPIPEKRFKSPPPQRPRLYNNSQYLTSPRIHT